MAEGSTDRTDESGGLTAQDADRGSVYHNTMARCSGVNVVGNISGQNVTLTANVTPQVTEEDWINQKIHMINERTVSKIQMWNEGMVRTSALEKVLNKLDKGTRWLTIKGSPGEGKTTCAYMALEELHRRGRQVFQVLTPDEYLEVTRNPSQSVIMLDDILGDLEFDEVEWVKWKAVLKTTLEALEHRSHQQKKATENILTVVILVGRDYVFSSASRDLGKFSDLITHERHVIEMSQRVERDFQEKLNIWNAIIKSSRIRVHEQDILNICTMETGHGFPHVCRLFVTAYNENNNISVVSFFKAPLKFLNKTIEKLLDDDQKVVLFKEIIKGNGEKSTRELGNVDDSFRIIKTARDMVGTYLKLEGDFFMFDHPSVYDCVAYNLCKLYPLFAIENCELSFIHQRLRLQLEDRESIRSDTDLAVHIPRAYLRDLAKRFADGIQNGHLFYTLTHVACTDREFVEQMMSMVSMSMTRLLNLTDSESGEHFLILITQNKSPELFRYIDAHSDIRNNQRAISTVFCGVCACASSELLTYMLGIGCNLDINASYDNENLAVLAANTKDPEFVDQILSLGPDLDAATNCDNETLLHILCELGLLSAVERAIDMGADITLTSSRGTVMSLAYENNDVELMELLVKKAKGIDFNTALLVCEKGDTDVIKDIQTEMISQDGDFLLRTACRFNQAKVISFLADKGVCVNTVWEVRQTPLHQASYDSPESVRCLIDHGAHLNSRDRGGDTPLHVAAFMGSEECVDVLLGAGVDVNAQNKSGSTPLHWAVQAKSKICVELLLEAGSEVNIQSNDGSSALHMAAHKKSKECVELLLKAGADVNTQCKDGSTPLHKASQRGAHECMDVLMKAGADVNVQCQDGYTPLHKLEGIRSRECVEMLLRAGVDINAQSKDGSTPLHTSAVRGAHECVDALLKAGADVNRQNNDGHTPLQKTVERYSKLCKINLPAHSQMVSAENSKLCVEMLMKAERAL